MSSPISLEEDSKVRTQGAVPELKAEPSPSEDSARGGCEIGKPREKERDCYSAETLNSLLYLEGQAVHFLAANMRHLGLRVSWNLREDLELFAAYTGRKYCLKFWAVKRAVGTAPDGILPFVRNVVNESSRREDPPPRFKGQLYAPQAGVLARMREIETSPACYGPKDTRRFFNAGVLHERCSFGKTFLLGALACFEVPEVAGVRSICRRREGVRYIPATVVVCSGRVAAEFCETLARSAALRCVRIHSAASLKKVAESPLPADESERTVYVVKDGESAWAGGKIPTVSYFAEMIEQKVRLESGSSGTKIAEFDRVVFDDFDLLRLDPRAPIPQARFYWRTSATGVRGAGSGAGSGGEEQSPSLKSSASVCEKLDFFRYSTEIVTTVSCSADFSALEFGLPRPQFWRAEGRPVDVAAALARGEPVARVPDAEQAAAVEKVVFSGGAVAPPAEGAPVKILLCDFPAFDRAEKREIREEGVRELEAAGVRALALSAANANRFAREPIAVGVSCLLHGVNMGYLTHVVVDAGEFSEAEVAQIVGRGQRVGRAASLQVYFARSFDPERKLGALEGARFTERECPK